MWSTAFGLPKAVAKTSLTTFMASPQKTNIGRRPQAKIAI